MLENDEVLELFKKSLIATIKSIGKSDEIEVNFVQDSPSVDGKIINITEPNHRLIKEKLNYIRAQADSIALEFRLHEKKIHQSYISQNEITNDIFNAIEQSRIEAKAQNFLRESKKISLINIILIWIIKFNFQKMYTYSTSPHILYDIPVEDNCLINSLKTMKENRTCGKLIVFFT